MNSEYIKHSGIIRRLTFLSIIFVDVVTFVLYEYAKLVHEMCIRSRVSEPVLAYTLGHGTTKECYNEQFL